MCRSSDIGFADCFTIACGSGSAGPVILVFPIVFIVPGKI